MRGPGKNERVAASLSGGLFQLVPLLAFWVASLGAKRVTSCHAIDSADQLQLRDSSETAAFLEVNLSSIEPGRKGSGNGRTVPVLRGGAVRLQLGENCPVEHRSDVQRRESDGYIRPILPERGVPPFPGGGRFKWGGQLEP